MCARACVCVCVCARAREHEREHVCVCVCVESPHLPRYPSQGNNTTACNCWCLTPPLTRTVFARQPRPRRIDRSQGRLSRHRTSCCHSQLSTGLTPPARNVTAAVSVAHCLQDRATRPSPLPALSPCLFGLRAGSWRGEAPGRACGEVALVHA